jgi:hypothetical protein
MVQEEAVRSTLSGLGFRVYGSGGGGEEHAPS